MRWWDSLRVRLAAIVLATVLPIAISDIVEEGAGRAEARRWAQQDAKRLAAEAGFELRTAMATALSVLTVLADHPAVRGLEPAACGEILGRVMRGDPRFALLTVYDRSGRPVCSGAPLEGQAVVAGQPWFEAALQSPAAPADAQGAPQALPTFEPAVPLRGGDGRPAGVLHARLSLAWFAERVGHLPMPAGVELIVAAPDGALLASYPMVPPEDGRALLQPIQAALRGRLPGEAVRAPGLDGVERAFVLLDIPRPTESAGLQGIIGWATGPLAEAERARMVRHLLFMGGITALMLAVGFLGGERLIFRPLRDLVRRNQDAAGAGPAAAGSARPVGDLRALAAILDSRASTMAAQRARLTDTEALLRTVVDGVPAVVDVKDADGRYLLVNARLATLVGKPVEWFVGKRPADVYPAPFAREIQESMSRAVQAPTATGIRETVFVDEAGAATTWLDNTVAIRDAAGAVKFIVTIAFDVSELKRSQEALADSERLLRSIVDHVPATVVLKRLDGRYLLINKMFTQRYGVPVEDPARHTVFDLLPSPVADSVAEQDRRVAATLEANEVETDVVIADGRVRRVSRVAFPVFDGAGKLVAVGSIGLDVTEQRATEERLRRAEAMQAIGRLTGGVAHEFNNLLAIILGRAELMTERPATEQDIQAIIRAATRAADLTRRLRSFSRKQVLSPRAIDLGQLVAGMEVALRRMLGEKIALRIVAAPDAAQAMADPVRVEDALLNLVDNARDAMAAGGVLAIEIGNFAPPPGAAGGAARPGEFVMLSVGDTGTGMPPHVLARAFQPFFTTKPEGKGNGLGLATIHGFVEQSGGWMTIDSAEGQGTTVRLYLPRAAAAAQSAAPPLRAPAAVVQPPQILLVEDEADVRDLAAQMLVDLGYRVLAAADGHAALALLEKTPDVDLLLSDVILTDDLDGVALAHRAQRLRPGLPVLYMSGYTGTTRLAELDEGVNLISKPFHKAELNRMIGQALAAAGGQRG
jgi:PAS domain S-box-containing protein